MVSDDGEQVPEPGLDLLGALRKIRQASRKFRKSLRLELLVKCDLARSMRVPFKISTRRSAVRNFATGLNAAGSQPRCS